MVMKKWMFIVIGLVAGFFVTPASVIAQNKVGALKSPAVPTHIDVKERTIQDLLYFPFTCINAYMPTKEIAWQEITDTFGTCETINCNPGLHAGKAFDFTYRGVTIGICYYDWMDDRTWYDFFFSTKSEADKFYQNLVKDIQNAGIPLTKDNIYGGMSNRKKPVSVFKWVSVIPPVKVKEPSPSNIETADVVGMYMVDLGVYKKKRK
jgi:hypothetical protein